MTDDLPELTVRDRVLIQLYHHRHEGDGFLFPDELSLRGLADSVGIRYRDLSRTMGPLLTNGTVKRWLGHTRGGGRRRWIHGLTPNGMEEAANIWKAIENFSVSDDKGRVFTLSDIRDMGMSPLEAIRMVQEGRPSLPAATEIAMPSHRYLTQAPNVRELVGRERELGRLMEMLKSHTVIQLAGPPGIGKTALARWMVEGLDRSVPVGWWTVHRWDSARVILRSLSVFLTECGRVRSGDRLEVIEGGAGTGMYPLDSFMEDMEGLGAVLVFDNLQEASNGVRDLIGSLSSHPSLRNNATVLLVEREIQPWGIASHQKAEGWMGSIFLEPLPKEDCETILVLKGIGRDRWDRAHRITGGNPLYLLLLDPEGDWGQGDELDRFISREMLGNLDRGDRGALELLSLLRIPVSISCLLRLIDRGKIDSLTARGMLVKDSGGGYHIPAPVSRSLTSKMDPRKARRLHARIAKALEVEPKGEIRFQVLTHLANGGKRDRAMDMLEAQLDPYIQWGGGEVVLEWLSEMDEGNADPSRARLAAVEARVRNRLGGWDAVSEHLFQVGFLVNFQPGGLRKENAPLTGEDRCRGLDYTDTWRPENAWDEAVRGLELGLIQLRDLGDDEGEAQMLLERAWVLWRASRWDESIGSYDEAVVRFEELGRHLDVCRGYLGRATVLFSMGRYGNCSDELDRVLNRLREMGNLKDSVRAMDLKGQALLAQDDRQGARDWFQRAGDAAREMNFLLGEAYSSLHRSMSGGDFHGGMGLDRISEVFLSLKDRDGLFYLQGRGAVDKQDSAAVADLLEDEGARRLRGYCLTLVERAEHEGWADRRLLTRWKTL